MYSIYVILLVLTRIVSNFLLLLIIFNIFILIIPVFDDAVSFNYISYLLELDHRLLYYVRRSIPTVIRGFDTTRWVIMIGALIIKAIIDYQSENLRDTIDISSSSRRVKKDRGKKNKEGIKVFFSNIWSRVKKIFLYRKSEVRRLQNKLAKIKQRLDKFGRRLTFLSMDVVSSTEMKKDLDPSLVDFYFRSYKEYVSGILKRNNCIKSSWTPDGVMGCFNNFPDAFNCSKQVLEGLNSFNSGLNLMKAEFKIRCGINSGFIYFDELASLNELVDKSIDIAAHIQENAKPNSILVSRLSVEPVELLDEFEESIEEIDGNKICVWTVNHSHQEEKNNLELEELEEEE